MAKREKGARERKRRRKKRKRVLGACVLFSEISF